MFPRPAVNLDNSLDGRTLSEKVRTHEAVALGCDAIKICGGWDRRSSDLLRLCWFCVFSSCMEVFLDG